MRHFKKHTLDNGEIITAKELADKLDISTNCARMRLKHYTDPISIYMPKGKHNKNLNRPTRKYIKSTKIKVEKLGVSAQRIYDTKPINDPMSKIWMRMA